jgi:peptidoglycan/LPS O-acetylase OafA/YrhL
MSIDNQPINERFPYIPAVDGLRAVAVLAVIVFHLRAWRLPGGFTGVDIFFVISGFVVTSSLRGTAFSRPGELLRYFYARRVIRIVPALAAMLVVTALLTVLFIPSASVMTKGRQTALSAAAGVSNVYLALSRSGYFGTASDHNPFLHTWTLGVEEQFYLLFPFLYYFWHRQEQTRGRRRGVLIVAAGSVVSFILCAYFSTRGMQYDFYLMPSRFWELGAGMLLALTFDTWRPRVAGAGSLTTLPLLVLSFGAIVSAFVIRLGSSFPFPGALLPVAGTAALIVLACSRPDTLAVRALSHPLAVYLGKISYSLYLWHWPAFALFRWTVGLNGRLEGSAALLITFLAANASYYFLERPLRRSSRIAGMPRLRIIVAGVCIMLATAGVILALFRAEPRLSLSETTYGFRLTLPEGACPVAKTSRPFEGGVAESWIPQCVSAPFPRKLVVIGDSHARIYGFLLDRYASEAKVPVYLYYKYGCGFARISRADSAKPECSGFARAALRELKRDLTANDALFLSAMRIPRLAAEPQGNKRTARNAAEGYAEAFAQLTELSSTKATLVLEAPKPVFRNSPYRCGEWFNRRNPECIGGFETTRAQMQQLRAPVMVAMERLAREVPGVVIWDPLPILCPGDPCRAWTREGLPLYFDGDHITGYANDLLFPSFRDFIASSGADKRGGE